MGFFGIGTEKKTDVDEEKQKQEEEDDEGKTEEEGNKETGKEFVRLLNNLTEKQLLKLILIMRYEETYDSIFDDWDDTIKAIKEDE